MSPARAAEVIRPDLASRSALATVRIIAGDDISYSLPVVTDGGRFLFSSRASSDSNLESFAQPMYDAFLYVP